MASLLWYNDIRADVANAKDKRNWEGMGIEIVLGVGGCFTEKNDTTSVSSSE